MSIREDLLNKYAEDMVNYCTMALNNSLQDALTSSVYLLNEKEQQILQMENKIETLYSELFAYREKHSHDTSMIRDMSKRNANIKNTLHFSGSCYSCM